MAEVYAQGMLLPAPSPPEGPAVARLGLCVLIILGLACVAYALTACASSAPTNVLQRDTAAVLHAKAKVIARPGPDTVAGAIEAKGQLLHDLCCYESDAGGALDGAPAAGP